MNGLLFSERMKELTDELVDRFQIPREAVEAHVRYLRNGCIAAKAEAENEDQLLLDFKEMGGPALADKHGVSERAIRKRREKILRKRMRYQMGHTASA